MMTTQIYVSPKIWRRPLNQANKGQPQQGGQDSKPGQQGQQPGQTPGQQTQQPAEKPSQGPDKS